MGQIHLGSSKFDFRHYSVCLVVKQMDHVSTMCSI